jgi:hypothetical protein
LKTGKKGVYLYMNAISKLELVRDLARSKMLELQPFAGEEMNLPQTDAHRAGFVDGERTLALQILGLIDDEEHETDPIEQEMVLGR